MKHSTYHHITYVISYFLIILWNEFPESGEGVVGLHPGGRAPGAGVQLERGVGGPHRGRLVHVWDLSNISAFTGIVNMIRHY